MNFDKAAFGWRLATTLRKHKMTLTDMCEKTGLSMRTMVDLRKGRRKPQLYTVNLIAEAVSVDANWLMWGEE